MHQLIEPVVTKEYRGYVIKEFSLQHFEVWQHNQRVTESASWWGCIVYIDELLSP